MFANSFDVDRAVFRFRDADNYNDCAHRPSGPLHRQFGQLHRSSGLLHWPSSPFFCSLKTPTTVFLVQIKLCRCTKSAVVPLCEIVDSRMTRHFAFAAQIIGVKIGDNRHFRASGWRYLHRFSVCPQLVDAVEVNKRCQTRKQGAVRLGSGGLSGLGGKGPSGSGAGPVRPWRQGAVMLGNGDPSGQKAKGLSDFVSPRVSSGFFHRNCSMRRWLCEAQAVGELPQGRRFEGAFPRCAQCVG